VMKALSDETRMRIVNILKDGDLCVCEIEVILDINQSNASRHLNKLTNAKILEYYKVAKYVYYKLNENTLKEFPFIKEIIETQTFKVQQCNKDCERLQKYRKSGISCDDLKDGKLCFDK
jgi:ArsR family transcriptional regulator, arsenate/arsenite/antimonite-responsive transcriptional repressor